MAAPFGYAPMAETIAAEAEENLALLENEAIDRSSTEARAALEAAQAACRNLQHELAGMVPATLKRQWQPRLQQFQRRLQVQQRLQLMARSSIAAPLLATNGAVACDHQSEEQAQVRRQQSALAMLQQSNSQLEQTAVLGQETIATLADQTRQVQATTETVRDSNGLLGQAKSLLGKMLRPFRI
jgi:hypothetical protein